MKNMLLPLLVCVCAWTALAQQKEALRIYFVPKVQAISPGTMTEDRFWKDVPPSASFVLNAPKKQRLYLKAAFRAVYNDTHLLVRIDAEEPQADKLDFSRAPSPRDSSAVFSPGHVEIFLDPGPRFKSVGQVVANLDGGIYDAIVCGGTKDWTYEGVQAKGLQTASGWSLFVACPFRDPGVDVANVFSMYPHSTPVIGFNVCRSKSVCGQYPTQWSKTPDWSYDRPTKYGLLVMTGESKAIGTLQDFLTKKASGEMILEGKVKNASSIYRKALDNALACGESNARMLQSPRREQIQKELKKLRKDMGQTLTDAQLARLLGRCQKLNLEITETQMTLSDDLLDEI